ncbi:hypothetical protein Pst134EA_023156 [Puccinia striiformis f. sp. tritici]|uniref:Uncharacterized protein n=1 Tax=Puccinia striiformis f. sp. tritici PST-78 TaxID=1165861 RepID=A0A0L0VJM5_9BASI|nr:hypothetical protein Pst134EA_023156 [Puccinia striiformis f. sp. tritici]KAH9446160.1 hypothetical protein Pst134EB_023976 [Puccinia striiformis f. sp. tritici]KAH9455702.1 hypothetical protein Pst134EA_023156 [Puccinia striiformis f. sp. tritici]KNE99460.1 hypothetical protein PSTG_07179 [Puccinia striiformis f. sp. tritici PST-78]
MFFLQSMKLPTSWKWLVFLAIHLSCSFSALRGAPVSRWCCWKHPTTSFNGRISGTHTAAEATYTHHPVGPSYQMPGNGAYPVAPSIHGDPYAAQPATGIPIGTQRYGNDFSSYGLTPHPPVDARFGPNDNSKIMGASTGYNGKPTMASTSTPSQGVQLEWSGSAQPKLSNFAVPDSAKIGKTHEKSHAYLLLKQQEAIGLREPLNNIEAQSSKTRQK